MFWFFMTVNNSLKSLYSLEMNILITESLLISAYQLYSIFVSEFFISLCISSAVIVKIFTPSHEFRTEYNFVSLLLLAKFISLTV